jgi:hypothetical protein
VPWRPSPMGTRLTDRRTGFKPPDEIVWTVVPATVARRPIRDGAGGGAIAIRPSARWDAGTDAAARDTVRPRREDRRRRRRVRRSPPSPPFSGLLRRARRVAAATASAPTLFGPWPRRLAPVPARPDTFRTRHRSHTALSGPPRRLSGALRSLSDAFRCPRTWNSAASVDRRWGRALVSRRSAGRLVLNVKLECAARDPVPPAGARMENWGGEVTIRRRRVVRPLPTAPRRRDRKSTRLNSSHNSESRMPSSA